MIDEKYFVDRTILHLINNMNISEHLINRFSVNGIRFYGIDYIFNSDRGKIDVQVEPVNFEEKESFEKHLKNIQKPKFWKQDFLIHLKEKRNEYKPFFKNLKVEENGCGNYHIRADLNTKNEDKAFFAVFYGIIRPVNLFNDERVR